MNSEKEQVESITQTQAGPEASSLSLDAFSYEIPPELIATEPCPERSASRLMVLNRKTGTTEKRVFAQILDYLKRGDCLVLNNTKVIPARITAQRKTGGAVDILLLKAQPGESGLWQAMATPLRKLKIDDELSSVSSSGEVIRLRVAGFCETADGQRRVLLDFGGQKEMHQALKEIGKVPLPPYILSQRQSDKQEHSELNDLDRYQTVYASAPGAVAAPTAGLHFSEKLLQEIREMGVETCFLTLHVGPGTFKPITESVENHTVESEEFEISEETAATIQRCKLQGGRIIAVGTTSCRALETAGATGIVNACTNAASSLYIKPGHKFESVDALITNFHLSRSSLLVLVSAFAGHDFVMRAYKEAIEERFRFYSYGDAMFIH